jgi:hypothetical protein
MTRQYLEAFLCVWILSLPLNCNIECGLVLQLRDADSREAFEIALGPLDDILTLIGAWPLAFWAQKDDLLACCVQFFCQQRLAQPLARYC